MKTNANIYISLQNAPYEKTRGSLIIVSSKATASFTLGNNHIDVSVDDGVVSICNRGEISYLMRFDKKEFSTPIVTPFGTTDVRVKIEKIDYSITDNSLVICCEYYIENDFHVFKLRGKLNENSL